MKEDKAKQGPESGISIRIIGSITTLIAIALAFYAFTLAGHVGEAQEAVAEDEKCYIECSDAINELQTASDYLTSQARSFVVTGDKEYLDNYLNELDVTNRRGKAVEVLRVNFSPDDDAAKALEQALAASDALAQTELAAMKLAANHYGIDDIPQKVERVSTSVYKRDSSELDDIDIASNLVLGKNYDNAKQDIQAKVDASSTALLADLDAHLANNKMLVQTLLFQLRIAVALLLCVIMVLVLALFMYVLKPIGNYVKEIAKNEPLEADGAYELHYLANAYNAMYEDNAKRIEQLRAFAERDPLTGISNRSGYDNFLATHTRNIALILIDIRDFKEYNNVYGHDTGDEALICLASALSDAFRSTDFPCRIENDVFAVIMTNMSTDLRDVIVNKVELVNTILSNGSDDLPLITLAVGAAFSTEGMTDKEIYRAADSALHTAKESDSNAIVFYGESNAI